MARRLIIETSSRQVKRNGTRWLFTTENYQDSVVLTARRWAGYHWITVHTIWL